MTTAALNPSRVTRDYLLQLDHADNDAPILSVYGGKLTTYRRVAEEAVGKLSGTFAGLRASLDRPGEAAGR